MITLSYYIWLKRLVPFVVIILIWLGYSRYADYSESKGLKYEQDMAAVTAHLWVASAKYRTSDSLYLAYRDSVVESYGFSLDEVRAFSELHTAHPEDYENFSTFVAIMTDSLVQYEDSLRQERATIVADSLATLENPASGS